MTNAQRQAFIKAALEAVKEAGRLALFAAIAAVLAYATDKLSGLDPTSVWVLVGTALIRTADKFVHSNKNIEANGIAPF